jgi:hypothetical protein
VTGSTSDFLERSRWAVIGTALGISAGLVLAGFVLESQSTVTHFAIIAEPAGQSWVLTPPSTWCNITHDQGGVHYSCSTEGAGWISLNVTEPSRLSGDIETAGPSSIWIFPSGWGCDIEAQLSGVPFPCPPPFDPPGWRTWEANFSSAEDVNLFALQFDVANTVGVLPPAS